MAHLGYRVGKVHGDLNGRNVLVDTECLVWIIDFPHMGDGHVLADLAKMENTVLFEYTLLQSDELEAAPLDGLLAELATKDPAAFESIDRQNRRRVVRAVEVIRLTGQPYSSQRSGWDALGQAPGRFTLFSAPWPRRRAGGRCG